MEDAGQGVVCNLRVSLRLRFTPLEGRWLVKSEELGTFGYGETREEAEELFKKVVVEAIRKNLDRGTLMEYLGDSGIQWWVEPLEQDVSVREIGVSGVSLVLA